MKRMKVKLQWARAAVMLLLAVLIPLGAWAQDATESKIFVWLKDGSKTEVLFNQMPEFTYQDGNVSIQNGGTTLSWALANLKKFTFEDIEPSLPTNVQEVKTPKLDIAKDCEVYDLSGKLVKKRIRSLTELPKGTYIIKDGSVTTKAVKK